VELTDWESGKLADFFRDCLGGKVHGFLDDAGKHEIHDFGQLVTINLYTKGQFNLELCVSPRGGAVPMHRHPNIDSWEFYLAGQFDGSVAGKPFCSRPRGAVRIMHNQWHGGCSPEPAAFLSVQKWLNGVRPSSVGMDWEGMIDTKEHEALLAAVKSLEAP
jgi:hypothetical protein